MNLRAVDLNLLVVLDALLDEAHVSRAADRLALSQPATSAALDRCRHLFGDRLLERSAGGMRLTPMAEALLPRLKDALAGVRHVLAPPTLALAELRQVVRISMWDVIASLALGPLHAALSRTAPGLDIVVYPWQGPAAARDALTRGALDLAAAAFPQLEDELRREVLLEESYVVAMRRDHPAASDFNLDRLLSYPFVVVSGQGRPWNVLDEVLSRQGRRRRVGVVVPSFLLVPALLEASDLVAMLPSRTAHGTVAERLAVREPPIAVEGFAVRLAWHRRRDEDAGVRHVARTIREVMVRP